VGDPAREQSLFEPFERAAIRRGNELYFDQKTALRFIDACDVHNFTVIGIEGFWISEQTTEPDPRFIADYSSRLTSVERSQTRSLNNEAARRFVEAAPASLRFNFVVSDCS